VLGVTAWWVADVAGLVAAGAAILTTGLFSAYTYRRIGGATGDTLGATCEIAELATALALLSWPTVVLCNA